MIADETVARNDLDGGAPIIIESGGPAPQVYFGVYFEPASRQSKYTLATVQYNTVQYSTVNCSVLNTVFLVKIHLRRILSGHELCT